MIQVEHIVKSYSVGKQRVEALKDVMFEVADGELFGLVGPDGAGKTTLFRILTTLLTADSGLAVVNGLDVIRDYKAIRRMVGYMPGRFSLYPDLSVEENLTFFARVFNTDVIENYDLIKDIYVQIELFRKRRAGVLSGGMKQKLALCCALVHKPKVLFLDEPTTGVDPVSRKEFWDMLGRLKNQGITILVSTPYMDEADRCDRIAFMMDGEILSINTPAERVTRFDRVLWTVRGDRMMALLADLRSCPEIECCFAFGDSHHVTLRNRAYTMDQLDQYLRVKGHDGVAIHAVQATMEDCFMRETGGGMKE